jgi:hypothetical protein
VSEPTTYPVFPPPPNGKIVAEKNAVIISTGEADAIVQSWKAEARRIGKQEDRSNQVIISMFDYTGTWSKPFVDAGYTVLMFDIQHEGKGTFDIFDGEEICDALTEGKKLLKIGGELLFNFSYYAIETKECLEKAGKKVVGILSATPCTTFAVSGAQHWPKHDTESFDEVDRRYGWFAAKHFDSPKEYNIVLVDATKTWIETFEPAFYAMENPVGRIAALNSLPEPTLTFHPYLYGDTYTKKTQLWGVFNPYLPQAAVDPVEGSKMAEKLGSSNKIERSTTPTGFAYSFFMANVPNELDKKKISEPEENTATSMSKSLIRRNSGYKGMAKIGQQARRAMREHETSNQEPATSNENFKPPTMNPFIGDNFFKQNPSKVLGEQSIKKGRFGSDMIVVKGGIDAIQKIDAVPVKTADLYPTQTPTATTSAEAIKEVFANEAKEDSKKKVESMRNKESGVRNKAKSPNSQSPIPNSQSHELYSFSEIDNLYNIGISRDEKEAYYFTHPELNYKLLFDTFTNSKQDLINKALICYDPGEKRFVYVFTYQSGNISRKLSDLKYAKDKFIADYGQAVYDRQVQQLESVRPKAKSFVGDDRIIILPHSNFSKDFKIEELRYGKPELYGSASLFEAFKMWLRQLPADNFKKSTSHEIIQYYLENKSKAISKDNKQQRIKDEKDNINTKQRTKEEGDELFARFLSDELMPDDQAKLSYLWNEKFNAIAEPNLLKMPVCFQISKKFKAGAPLLLNATQRQAAAFQTEKFSALFAYGVGVGKTIAAIVAFSQAYYNKYANKALYVVPTNTYDKWLGEIGGYTDRDTKQFLHGAAPQFNLVGLFNLNPVIVHDTLKDYSKQDEAKLQSIMDAISAVKKAKGDKITPELETKVDRIYKVNWPGIHAQYTVYLENTKSAVPKNIVEYTADYLKDEYNYYVYELGTIKKFPDGTIFVTTEVGLQRLGVGEENKSKLTSQLYEILSQGEKTADEESGRDIAALQNKIDQTISSSLKNAKLLIEDFGINWVCFDEAHYYKKLFTYVKGDVKGEKRRNKYEDGEWITEVTVDRDKSKYELKSGQYPSGRALSAFVVSQFVQMNNQNRNVIQLTATPFTNSPLEVYSMLTLTNYQALKEMGLENMVDFFDTFMKINYDIKYTPQKTVVKDVVLTGYNNLPQLRQIIYTLMDKKDEGANLKRPVKIIYPSIIENRETTLPMTRQQEELMRDVKAYLSPSNTGEGSMGYADLCKAALQEEVDSIDYDGYEDDALIETWERLTMKEYTGDRDGLSGAKRDQLIEQIKKSKAVGIDFDESELNEDEMLGVKILRGLAMMRQITLSPFLYYKACKRAGKIDGDLPNYSEYVETSPKLKYVMGCIKSTMEWHKKNGSKPGGHVIYMNAGVEYFPLLKEYLVKKDILRESQIGIVSGSMSKGAKENVKRQFLNGDMLVLIGSSTISVGVDLQNNATTLYNCYYDWNPTDAAQIEGRIWRQNNRFAFVRIVYPQCYNSADPVIFEYLNQKTLRINEIWNRSSEIQELDLRDFNPKELQKKLITDPEEKADWEILEETDKLQGEIIYAQNRRESLQGALYSFKQVTTYKPKAIDWLTQLVNNKLTVQRKEAMDNQKEKLNELVEKFSEEPEKLVKEMAAYKKSRYDYDKDPEGKFTPVDYNTMDDQKIYEDAGKWIDIMNDWGWDPKPEWRQFAAKSRTIESDLNEFRFGYKDMKKTEANILKPMGLSFETAGDPLAKFDQRLNELHTQIAEIEKSKEQRVEKFKAEAIQNAVGQKTVADRIAEFARDNEKYLAPQLGQVEEEVKSEKLKVESEQPPVIATPPAVIASAAKQSNVIGKTKSGKDVLEKYDHYPHYSYQDMLDAAEIHSSLAKKHKKDKKKSELHGAYALRFMQDAYTEKMSNALAKNDEPATSNQEPATEIAVPLNNRELIEKQINGLKIAAKYAPDTTQIFKEIKALEIALKYAA